MAAITTPVADRDLLVEQARARLDELDAAGPAELFGADAETLVDGLSPQRIEVDDVMAVGGHAVALLRQRGRRPDGSWAERRLSAVFTGADARLHGSWVDGLDAASRL